MNQWNYPLFKIYVNEAIYCVIADLSLFILSLQFFSIQILTIKWLFFSVFDLLVLFLFLRLPPIRKGFLNTVLSRVHPVLKCIVSFVGTAQGQLPTKIIFQLSSLLKLPRAKTKKKATKYNHCNIEPVSLTLCQRGIHTSLNRITLNSKFKSMKPNQRHKLTQ